LEADHRLIAVAEPESSYSVKELVGCQVVTDQDEVLGLLVDVLPSGGNDIFVVQQGLREMMIPALKTVVRRIDVAAKRIEVALPPGLRDVYENA
jgi:16S rRNA processing protein RimM